MLACAPGPAGPGSNLPRIPTDPGAAGRAEVPGSGTGPRRPSTGAGRAHSGMGGCTPPHLQGALEACPCGVGPLCPATPNTGYFPSNHYSVLSSGLRSRGPLLPKHWSEAHPGQSPAGRGRSVRATDPRRGGTPGSVLLLLPLPPHLAPHLAPHLSPGVSRSYLGLQMQTQLEGLQVQPLATHSQLCRVETWDGQQPHCTGQQAEASSRTLTG